MLQAGSLQVQLLMGGVIDFFLFILSNPLSRTMALGFIQPVTEMSSIRFLG
jgi:hypothetical protein